MELRVLEPSDAEEFRRLRLQALQESPAAFGSDYSEALEKPIEWFTNRIRSDAGRFVIGAFENGAMVGVGAFAREEGIKARHKGSVTSMYVDPAARGRGIGRSILSEIIRRASGMNGLEQMILAVIVGNTAARALYASLGFRSYGIEPDALRVEGRSLDEEFMALRIERDV